MGIAIADGSKTIVARWEFIGLEVWGNKKTLAGCSKMSSGKAAASEDRRRTLWGARCDE